MSDLSVWSQKMMREQLGLRTASPTVTGPQEGTVVKVTTMPLQIAGQAPRTCDVVYFSLPNTHGPAAGFGPAAYQPVPGWTPSVGDPVIVVFVGNGTGRSYVVCFPTAVPT